MCRLEYMYVHPLKREMLQFLCAELTLSSAVLLHIVDLLGVHVLRVLLQVIREQGRTEC